MASRALAACRQWKPANSSESCTMSRIEDSSSTTRIVCLPFIRFRRLAPS